MNRRQFLNLMNSPQKLNGESVAMLDELVRQFPYCQTAHLLFLKNLHTNKSIHYNRQLKIAAAYSSDRKRLYEFIMQPGITGKIHEIEDRDTTEDISPLEREILKEAVNASIQLEVAQRDEANFSKVQNFEKVVNAKEERTFNEWLKIINKDREKSGVKPTPGETKRTKTGEELIDKFIKEDPQAIKPVVVPGTTDEPSKQEFFSPLNTARLSVIEDDNFVTETLAKIYEKQKNYPKAIKAYKILSLQNPDKSSTFAARIESIRELMNSD